MRGQIGEAEKQGRIKQEISKIDAETAVLETKRRAEKAKADSELMNRQTELDNSVKLAKIAAQRQAEMRDAELQKQVESKRAQTELERLRATEVTKSKVARESAEEKANAAFFTEQRAADARLYKHKLEADALCKYPALIPKILFASFELTTPQTIVRARKQMPLSTSKSAKPRE